MGASLANETIALSIAATNIEDDPLLLDAVSGPDGNATVTVTLPNRWLVASSANDPATAIDVRSSL